MVVEPALVNILLVDDEPGNLTALAAVLEGPDRRLVFASSGEESLRHLLREDFAVILLDVNMPGADGFTTAELIRGRDKSKDTPIIFLTAETRDKGFVSRGYSLGAVDYIVKPFDPEALRSKVGVFVDLFRKTEQVKQQATALAETTAFLNGVLESATEYAIAALDADGRFLTWNEGARRLYGFTAEEMIGRRSLAALQLVERPLAPADSSADSRRDGDGGVRERKAAELLWSATRGGKAEGIFEHVHLPEQRGGRRDRRARAGDRSVWRVRRSRHVPSRRVAIRERRPPAGPDHPPGRGGAWRATADP